MTERSTMRLPTFEIPKNLKLLPSADANDDIKKEEGKDDHEGGHDTRRRFNSTRLLFPHLPSVFYAVYLVYEELKLSANTQQDYAHVRSAAHALHALATDIGYSAYLEEFRRDAPELEDRYICASCSLTWFESVHWQTQLAVCYS